MKGTLQIQSWRPESHGYRLKLRCTACGYESEVVALGNECKRAEIAAEMECMNCCGFGAKWDAAAIRKQFGEPDLSTVTREEVELLAKHLAAGIRVNERQATQIKNQKEQIINLERQNRQLFAAAGAAAREDERRNGLVTRARGEQLRHRLTLALEHNAELRERLQAANRKVEDTLAQLEQQSSGFAIMEQRFREKESIITQLRADVKNLANTITILKSME